MVLIDSSSWIHWLRSDGDAAVGKRVTSLLLSGDACWCPMIRLELWNGAGGTREQKVLREMERDLVDLAITPEVWMLASALARSARGAGLSVPATDVLIAACARHHGAGLEHCDADFDRLADVI